MRKVVFEIMGTVVALLVGIALIVWLVAKAVTPAAAQPQCAPVEEVLAGLATGYDESLIGRGFVANGTQMLLFTHPEGDTWTIIVLMPDGTACLAASGTGWDARTPTPTGKET